MHNTGNDLESNDILDFSDNTVNLDILMNADQEYWTDRLGNKRPTIDYALRMAGFTPAGFDFTTGGVLKNGDRNKCVFNQADQTWYSWSGDLPYNVIAGSVPGEGWKVVNRNVLTIARETLRRTYLEAGYNLVDGSFEAGGTVTTPSDVLLYEANSKAYSWDGALPKAVALGSTPIGTGGIAQGAWLSVGDAALRSDLADPAKGAAMVARGVVAVDSIADLLALPAGQRRADLRYLVKGYHAGSDVGGGEFYWDASRTSENDGGVIIDGWKRRLSGFVTPEMYGSAGTTATDTQAIQAFADSSFLALQMTAEKTYTIDASVIELSGLQGKSFFGNGCTVRVTNGDLPIKSPHNVLFDKINFVGDRTGRQRVLVSNYNSITFNECSFRGFCNETLEADTYALMMYAGDTNSAITAPGDSTNGRIVNCDFDGERITMFGVRIYTEFGTIGTAKNTDTWVIGGNYDQYMWNAVEIAGPNTIGCGVTGWATAYNNALSPFDIDKGAKNCTVENVIIDKITGQPAPYGNNSRPSVVNIQGFGPTGIYSSGNTVRNVIATLYKSDLDAVINQGSAIATMAWSSGDDKIENVQVEVVGGQPVSTLGGKMGLAMLAFNDIGGCTVSDIRTNRASHGIVEVGTTGAGGSERKNYLSGFSSVNQIDGEAVCIAEGSADKRQFIISGIDLYSTKSATRKLNATVLNFQATNADTYIDVSESNIGVNSGFIVTALAPRIGFRKLFIYNRDNGHDRMFQSSNALTWLNLSDVVYNSSPIYCDTALASVSGSYTISTQQQHSEFDRFEEVSGSDLWVLNGAPANPVAANWPLSQRLRKVAYTTSSGYELVRFGSVWRSVGDLIP